MMSVNYIILRLLLPFLCITVYYVDAQGFKSFPVGTTSNTGTIVSNDGNEIEVDLKMNGATPTRANQTICTGFNLAANDQFFAFQFSGHADYSQVHHMGLYACSITPTINACRCPMTSRSPLYTWARFTPAVRYTGSETGIFGVFRVGSGTEKSFLFLETHYHHAFSTPDVTSGITIRITRDLNTNPPGGAYYELAIYSILGTGTIPANTASYAIDTCISQSNLPSSWSSSPTVIGFQSHTHNLGRVASTFQESFGDLDELAVGNPLWPNAYISPRASYSQISYTFASLASRCVYKSTGVNNATNTIGKFETNTAWREMCVQSFILGIASYNGPWSSTTPAFLNGKCTADQSAKMDGSMPSTFPTTDAATNDALNTYATNGQGSGSYDYTSAKGQGYNIDLTMQKFTTAFN